MVFQNIRSHLKYLVFQKNLIFSNLITLLFPVQMILNFIRMSTKNSKFYIRCLNASPFTVNGISILEKIYKRFEK